MLVVLLLIAIVTTYRAWPAFADNGLSYFFGTEWIPSENKFGILPLVWGTLMVSVIAVIVAVPVSIGIALFVTEMAHRRLRSTVVTVIDLLAAVPSVVFGLWGFYYLIPKFQAFFNWIADAVSGIPVLHTLFGSSTGSSFASAGLVLALMITPIITAVTREVFTTVPENDKSGALALGATRWEMIRGVVLPHSSGGMTGAVMLGLGRAMGETVAVALLIGARPNITLNTFGVGDSMPAQIFRNLGEANDEFRAALIGLGVCLFILTIVINVAARTVGQGRRPTIARSGMSDQSTLDPVPGGSDLERSLHGAGMRRGRRIRNGLASVMMVGAFLVAATPLAIMGVNVLSQGLSVVTNASWWTEPIPADVGRADLANNKDLNDLGFGSSGSGDAAPAETVTLGMEPAIVGTLLTIIGASALAVPLGIMGAVYLHEYGKTGRLASFIRFMTDVMTGVPSVIMGVFIYSIWVVNFGVNGKSAFAASLALACLMLPIIVRSTEEMLRLVPDPLREASAALGTRTWKTTVKVVLPAALPGITSGTLLAIARAAGETAPVVFTIGFVTTTNWRFTGQNTTLSAQIYSQLVNGGSLATQLAWGAAVTLIGIVLVLTLTARFITRRLAMD